MAKYTLENIIYQHVVYGTGTIYNPHTDSREALIQPHELQEAIEQVKPLLQSSGRKTPESSDPALQYDQQKRDSVLQEILRLYNATVIDGRFIDDLPRDPKSVAARLSIQISDAAEAELKEAGQTLASQFGTRFDFALSGGGKKIVAVVVAAIIVIREEPNPYTVVVDSSGVIKV